MKITFSLKLPFISVLVLLAMYFNGCTSDNSQDLKSFREDIKREDRLTNDMMEADLDDELNPVERRAVHSIFENNERSKERMVDDVFQDEKK
ncbi:MAG TPA: hypothetical protein DCZ94_16760 [Lentisphaeria bacterium]|nr:MAG: hypothetical protein A2X48_16770 [Lentisphaerae bacterium GWF2_49_21]HBC88600.1 hypothetical protein [Lentisphaeria bacterium]